jgi:uncharacterized oligopeptide transporter (OPT) family protein
LALGFVVPFGYALSMFLGAAIAAVAHLASREWAERYTVPICSGLIAGEGIMGVLVAIVNNFVLK